MKAYLSPTIQLSTFPIINDGHIIMALDRRVVYVCSPT